MVYLDGQFVPNDEARISVYDHGLLYGDGVFEGMRIYAGRVFLLDGHLERLCASARALALAVPLAPAALAAAVNETVARSSLSEGYIRLLVTRGVGSLGLDPDKCPRPSLIIIADTIQLYPERLYEEGVPLITAATRRSRPDMLESRVKSLNYLAGILAKIEAKQAGCPEAVMLNPEGYVAECTADNLFAVRGRTLLTPAPEDGALAGLTRGFVCELARQAGYEVQSPRLTRYDLYTADELFLTGSGAELVPAIRLDGRPIGSGRPGPVFQDLRRRFQAAVRA